ncbi:MAG: hypothetical protein NC429_08130 [Lachnospiraceae bacterium]|nr:hypothetical protein [Lachnospiraceae bacterium]
MNRKLEIIKNILAEGLNALMLTAAGAVFLTDFVKMRMSPAVPCVIVLLSLFFYGIREKCRKFFLFLLWHVLPGVLLFLFYGGNPFQKVWLFLVYFVLLFLSFGKKLRGAEMGMEAAFPPAFGGVMWILYLIDQRQGEGACAGFLFGMTAGYLCGYFLYYFLRQFLHYMDMNNRTTENIPVNHVFHSSAFLAGGFALLAGIVMILCGNREWMNRAGEILQRIVIGFFTFLFSLLKTDSPQQAESSSGYEMQEAMPWGEAEVVEAPLLMKILEAVLGIAALGAVMILLVLTILGIIRLIRERFAKRRRLRILEDGVHEDLVETIKRDKKNREKAQTGGLIKRAQRALSPQERIRRIYRRTIEKKMASLGTEGEKYPPGLTPREQCLELFQEQAGEALEFAVLYEKARYGEGLCGGEDVKKARKLAEAFHG